MKNSNGTIGIKPRDLPACSALTQSTAPPRVPCLLCSTEPRNHETMKCVNIARLPTVQCPILSLEHVKTFHFTAVKRKPLHLSEPVNIARYVSHRRRTDLFVLRQSPLGIGRITGIARAG